MICKTITLPGQEVTTEQTVYTYDANGSQLTKTTAEKTETNTYNAVNQLVGFADGETTASYAYNANGLRMEKIVNGQRINHVWDGSQQIVADVIDNQFYEANCYIRGTSLAATYNYCNGEKSGYIYYVQNAHGDVVNLTDAEGTVIKSYTYDAFGVEKNINDADANAFRYCGEYYDAETSTIYLRARYYNPSTGKFIGRDSYRGSNGNPLSLNLYTYCANNPLLYFDPSGHSFAYLPDGTKRFMDNPWDAQQFYKDRDIMSAPAPGCNNEHQTIGCCDSLVYPLSNTWKYMRASYRQKVLETRQRTTALPSRKEYYDTIDEAAIDFVLQYGEESITSWCEYDAVINAFDVDGVTMYKWEEYGIGEKRADEYGNPKYAGKGAKLRFDSNSVAYVHTHGQYVGWKNNCFSIGSNSDISIAYDYNVIAYVGVPNGNVLAFDPAYDVECDQANTGRVIFNKAPIDSNDPAWKVNE